jgi:O-antigen ligase
MPADGSRRVLALYGLLGGVYLLTFGVFNSALKEAFHTGWQLLVLLLSAAVLALDWVADARRSRGRRPGGLPLLMGLYALLLGVSWAVHHLALRAQDPVTMVNVQGLTVSYWRANNHQFVILYLFFPLLYLFHVRFLGRVEPLKLLRLVLGLVLVSVAVMLYQAHVDPALLNKWDLPPLVKFDGLSSDPNAFALLLYLVISAALVGAALERRRCWRALYVLSVPLLVYAVYLTGCRSALLSLALLLLAVPLVIGIADRRRSRIRRALLVGAPVVVLVAGVVGLPLMLRDRVQPGQANTLSRLASTLATIESRGLPGWFETSEPRMASFGAGLDLAREAPLAGWGPGGFYREFSNVIFRQRGIILDQQHPLDSALNHYLMIAGDFGLICAALNLVFVCLPVVLACRIFSAADQDRTRVAAGLAAGSLGIFLLFIAVMPPSYFPEVIWFWTGLMVLGEQLHRRLGPRRPPPGRWTRRALPLVALAALVLFGLGSYHSAFGSRGYAARRQARWWPADRLAEQGFYPYETVDGIRCRWTGRTAVSRLHATSDVLEFDLAVSPQNSRVPGGLTLRVEIVGHRTRTLTFTGPRRLRLRIHAPGMAGKRVTVRLTVDPTFNPSELGHSGDDRDLGVLVGAFSFPGSPR